MHLVTGHVTFSSLLYMRYYIRYQYGIQHCNNNTLSTAIWQHSPKVKAVLKSILYGIKHLFNLRQIPHWHPGTCRCSNLSPPLPSLVTLYHVDTLYSMLYTTMYSRINIMCCMTLLLAWCSCIKINGNLLVRWRLLHCVWWHITCNIPYEPSK